MRFRNADGNPANGLEEALYYATDASGKVTSLVSAAGQVVERYVYDPYGKVTIYNPAWTSEVAWSAGKKNEVLYAGYRYDSETALYNVRHREYHPTLGRFIQRDSVGYSTSMNLYAYVSADPITGWDPLGLCEPTGGSSGTGVARPNKPSYQDLLHQYKEQWLQLQHFRKMRDEALRYLRNQEWSLRSELIPLRKEERDIQRRIEALYAEADTLLERSYQSGEEMSAAARRAFWASMPIDVSDVAAWGAKKAGYKVLAAIIKKVGYVKQAYDVGSNMLEAAEMKRDVTATQLGALHAVQQANALGNTLAKVQGDIAAKEAQIQEFENTERAWQIRVDQEQAKLKAIEDQIRKAGYGNDFNRDCDRMLLLDP